MHTHPAVSYRPLLDAPDVEVFLAWRQPPSHPAVTDLVELVREVVAAPPSTDSVSARDDQ